MILTETRFTGNLERDLDVFEQKVQGQVVLSGVAAMARVIYDEVKVNVTRRVPPTKRPSVQTGLLESAIYRVYVKERSGNSQQIYRVSVNKSKAPHWHFLEYGTSREPARPYIRPAFDRVGEAIDAGRARMRERLDDLGSDT